MRASRSGESALLLLDVIDVLSLAGVQYAVIGAMAAAAHGVVRASVDADVVLSLPSQRLGEIERRLRAAGLETELRLGDADDPIGAVLALSDAYGNRVDLLAGLRGFDPRAFSRLLEVPFQGERLQVIGREDFIAMKIFAHGPQDLEDARLTLAAAGPDIDIELLRRAAVGYGEETSAALERLLDTVSKS